MNRIQTYVVFSPCLDFWPAFQFITKYISYVVEILVLNQCCDHCEHGLRKPNEGINQRNLKIWADVADKIGFGCT